VNCVEREVVETELRPGALKECESFPVLEVTEDFLPLPEKQETHIRIYAVTVSTLISYPYSPSIQPLPVFS
jgi:hypothetical protein